MGMARTAHAGVDLFTDDQEGAIAGTGRLATNANPGAVAAQVINAVLGFLGVIFLGLMIYGGFIWMLARGNDDEVQKAQGTIRSAIIGLVIVLASYGISYFIFSQIETATGL